MRNKTFKVLIIVALCLLPLTAIKATGAKTGDNIYVAKDEVMSGNLYAAGQTVTIDGVVGGDVIAAAQTININGRVEGDIIAVAQDVTINGEVGGNVRIAGNSLTVNGTVTRNVNSFGANIVFGSESRVGWDVYLAGANIETRGTIDGNLDGYAGKALITGKIGKNINLKLDRGDDNQKLTIAPEAIIGGDVTYTSKNAASISEKASVAGKVAQQTPPAKETNIFLMWLCGKLFAIFAAIVVGLFLVFFSKNITTKVIDKMEEKPFKMLLPGLIFMFILPPIALVLAFTLIGIPMALIISTWWLTSVYTAKIMAAILVGKMIVQKISKKKQVNLLISLILGVVICWLLFAIPFVGWLLGLVAIWLGLGGLWTYASHQLRNL
jgi:cytoskeletal protein CcmA (bactofilin family)